MSFKKVRYKLTTPHEPASSRAGFFVRAKGLHFVLSPAASQLPPGALKGLRPLKLPPVGLRPPNPSIQAFTKRRAPASGTKTGFPGTRRTQRRNSMKELRPNPEKMIIFGGKLSENEKITTTSQHCSTTDELPGLPRLGEGGRQQICGPSGERARFPWPLFLGPGQTGARHLLLLHRTRSRPPSGKDITTK